MNKTDHDHFVKSICAHLDTCVEQIDPAIHTRLDAYRGRAVAAGSVIATAEDDSVFANDVRRRLAGQATLPPSVASRLDAARKQAVTTMRQQQANSVGSLAARARYAFNTMVAGSLFVRPANMIATACVMVTAVSLFFVTLQPAGTYITDEELALIAATDDFELVENLDFYMWLAENGLPE